MRVMTAIWSPVTLTISFVALAFCLSAYFAIPAVFAAGDARCRWREFKKLQGRVSEKVVRLYRGSFCQRSVVIAASKNPEATRRLYRRMGYRPWHFFMDGAFTKNSPFLMAEFYLGLLSQRKRK